MLLRVLIAGLILSGGLAAAAWIAGPGAWREGDSPHKSDRLSAADTPPASAADPTPATTAAPHPAPSRFNTALLSPNVTVVAPPASPSAARQEDAQRQKRSEPRKPFRCPRGTPAASGPPTRAQIARLETALQLSPQQEKQWRPVERALMEIARHFEKPGADGRRGKELLSVERMQQIYWMAGPLVMNLREEQKHEARTLACAMGLAAVAALI